MNVHPGPDQVAWCRRVDAMMAWGKEQATAWAVCGPRPMVRHGHIILELADIQNFILAISFVLEKFY